MEVIISTYVNGDVGKKKKDIAFLNKVVIEDCGPNDEVEILELPSNNCSIIMNGHHKFNIEAESHQEDEEKKPFLNQNGISHRAKESTGFLPPKKENSNLSSNIGDSAEDSEEADEEPGALPESSRHLLKNDDVEESYGPKCKVEITKFKSSPKKSKDPHSHVHHRPLGRDHSPTFNSEMISTKLNWAVVKFVCVVIMLSFVVALTCVFFGLFMTNPNECQSNRQWWQGTVTYEIFPASFLDTDSDGFGDFRGIIQKLDYIKNLSVDVVRLNSIFSALDYPLEYEHVINFSNVDPHLGRMEDFRELVFGIHRRGMKIVLDLNPTVTSDQHTWAAHWLLHRQGKYENYYINSTVIEDEPPMEPAYNNSQKDAKSPHRTFGSHLTLNWTNPLVQAEFLEILEFWLRMGIDGFYIKRMEDMQMSSANHLYSVLNKWRRVLDFYSTNTSRKILVTCLYSLRTIEDRSSSEAARATTGLFDVIDAAIDFTPNRTLEVSDEIWSVRRWAAKSPTTVWISWHLGSVETSRLGGRVGRKYVMNCLFFLSLFPGSVSFFYGDEIGMADSYDPISGRVYKGGQLAPMQWTSSVNANFTNNTSKPWMPVHPSYSMYNVEDLTTNANVLQQLLAFRKVSFQPVPQRKSMIRKLISKVEPGEFMEPNYKWYHDTKASLIALEATFDHIHKYLLFANFGQDILMLDILSSYTVNDRYWNGLDLNKVKVVFTTAGITTGQGVGDIILDAGQVILCISVT